MQLIPNIKRVFAIVDKNGDRIWSERAGEVWYRRDIHDFESVEWMQYVEENEGSYISVTWILETAYRYLLHLRLIR